MLAWIPLKSNQQCLRLYTLNFLVCSWIPGFYLKFFFCSSWICISRIARRSRSFVTHSESSFVLILGIWLGMGNHITNYFPAWIWSDSFHHGNAPRMRTNLVKQGIYFQQNQYFKLHQLKLGIVWICYLVSVLGWNWCRSVQLGGVCLVWL